jgi:hypothetical protein
MATVRVEEHVQTIRRQVATVAFPEVIASVIANWWETAMVEKRRIRWQGPRWKGPRWKGPRSASSSKERKRACSWIRGWWTGGREPRHYPCRPMCKSIVLRLRAWRSTVTPRGPSLADILNQADSPLIDIARGTSVPVSFTNFWLYYYSVSKPWSRCSSLSDWKNNVSHRNTRIVMTLKLSREKVNQIHGTRTLQYSVSQSTSETNRRWCHQAR